MLAASKHKKLRIHSGTHFHADYNTGAENTIYAGGETPSYLLLPVIPPIKSQAESASSHATEPIR